MLNQMKAMGAVAGLLRDRDKLKAAGVQLKQRLDDTRVEGDAGAGAVRVCMTGRGKVIDVNLAPALIASGDADMIAGAVREACNDAIEKTQVKMREEAARAARKLGIPNIDGLSDMLGGF